MVTRIYKTSNISFKFRLLSALILLLQIFLIDSAVAVRTARPTPTDSRIRVMVYHPNDVFQYTGYYGYQASIELATGEEVVSISMGDTTGWQIVPAGNRLFIKPIEQDATTNMTLITNKRIYFFELYAENASDIRDPNMIFNIKFIYPDQAEDENLMLNNSGGGVVDSGPDLLQPELLNFNYFISGDEVIAPIKVFDDGEFTYLQFRKNNHEIPAIFAVDEDLREAMVNFHPDSRDPNVIIIEQVFKKLSLRTGNKIVCIYNAAF